VLCPHCRGVRQEARTLGDVPARGRCDVCEIDFDTDSENAIEITFHLHPSIRDVPKLFFCAAEPATKQHIAVQHGLAPGARARVETSLAEGTYRVRLRGEQHYRALAVTAAADAPREVSWVARPDDAPGDADALRAGVAPALLLANERAAAQTFIVEDVRWSDNALRPVQLFTLQEFRDLFSEEFLTADVQLSIGEQTVLFTDMIGSTRFYDDRGDPEAFAEVKRHFREVYEVVKTHRGAVVKTIGDAVMAAFHQPVDALAAAEEIHKRFPAGRADTSIRLRVSLNRGPCIAVNLNSAIDYFGRTVNLASKLQACVEAGQVSFPRALRDAPGVADFLARRGAVLEEVVVRSASLSAPIEAYRWDVNASAASAADDAQRASLLGV
jgi:class 3 adenylate cyclase